MIESTKATIEILEHYHHSGGFYEIPVEVINTVEQELEEQDKEIERLNNIIKQQNTRNSRQRIANRKLLERNQDLVIENLKLNNITNKIEEHFVFLKMNSTGGNKEFFEDILDLIKALKELKGSDKVE